MVGIVVEFWTKEPDSVPSPANVESDLKSSSWRLKIIMSLRIDYEPTDEQIERGLNDEDIYIRHAWMQRLQKQAESSLTGDIIWESI